LKTVSSIYTELQREQTPLQVSLINTRVLLQTGVNLRNITPEQDHDPSTIAKVTTVLEKLGIAA
jgi:hypothetical protein